MTNVTINRVTQAVTIERLASPTVTVTSSNATAVVIQRDGLVGPPGPAGAGTVYTYSPPSAQETWLISHSLGRYPSSVIVSDSTGAVVFGDISYPSINLIQISFAVPVFGEATYS